MAALLVGLLVLGLAPGVAAQAPASPGRVLVLPFTDVRHVGRIYWMSEGAAVLLGEDLARLDQPVVAREDRRRAFEQLQIPLNVELTDATAIRVARLVGATRIIRGTLRLEDGKDSKDGETLVARVRQLHIDTGRMDAPVDLRAPLKDLFSLCARMAQALAPHATISEAALVANHPSLDAFQDYIKGLLAQDPATRVRYLRSAIALAPGLDRARLALWAVYSDQGEDDQALAVVREVSEDSGLRTQARFRAALSLIRLKQYGDAESTLSALSRETPAAAILNDLGIVQLRSTGSGDLKRAAYFFTEATKANPDHADYFFNLGYTYWLQHDAHAAIYWLREAVRRHPADGAAHFVLAVALSASGEQAQAERERALAGQLSSDYADRIRKAAPGMPVVPRGLARIDTVLGGPPDVSGVLSDSRQEDRDATAAFYLERAQRLAGEHDDRAAIADLKRCLFLSPYDADAQLLLGRVYLRLRRTKEAISVLKISLWSEETADAHAALAQAYLQAGNRDGARSEATRALALDPAVDGAQSVLDRLKATAKPSPKRGAARPQP
ncbi:MAG TPA: tetratricopeptide repeat protein [Vicinamibacterales bacterium]|jgi:predicted Zn-dependent protease